MKQRCTKLLALLLTLSMLLALTACAGSGDANTPAESAATPAPVTTPAPTPTPAVEEPPASEYPMTLADMAGHELTLEEPVETVALTWRMANDLLLVLGAKDRMICVGPLPDFDALVAPNWVALSGLAGRGTGPDWEAMAGLDPDIYINGTNSETLEAGDQLGIPVLAVSLEDAEETMTALRLVGKALGLEERAEELIKYYNDIMSIPAGYLTGIPESELPTFVLLSGEGEQVGVPAMMQAQMVATGGGVNAAADVDDPDDLWPAVGIEQVFSWDPDYIFMSSTADKKAADVLSDPAWADLTAVKNGNVYDVPSDLHSWESLGLVPCIGAVWSFMKMHPGLYSEAEFDQLVADFYKEVYDLDVNREMLGY